MRRLFNAVNSRFISSDGTQITGERRRATDLAVNESKFLSSLRAMSVCFVVPGDTRVSLFSQEFFFA